MDYIALAQAALGKRAALFEQLKATHADSSLTPAEKSERMAKMNADIDALGAEAEGHVRAAERDAEHRDLNARAAQLAGGRGNPNQTEWRAGLLPTAGEWRALLDTSSTGEAAVPTKVAARYRELLVGRSAFMSAPGLTVEPFTGGSFVVPRSDGGSDDASVVAEGEIIPVTEITLAPLTFTPSKYAERVRATYEIVEDANVNVNDLVSRTLIKRIAAAVDADAFEGDGADGVLLGVTASSNCTTETVDESQISHDHLIQAYSEIVAVGGTPTVCWVAMDQYAGLVAERATVGGTYLNGQANSDPARAAWGVPILPAPRLGSGQVVLADASELMVGLRQDVRMSRSEDFEFDRDLINFKITFRIAGIRANDKRAVRRLVVTPAEED